MRLSDAIIRTAGDFKVAWFTDPDGNVFAIEQRR